MTTTKKKPPGPEMINPSREAAGGDRTDPALGVHLPHSVSEQIIAARLRLSRYALTHSMTALLQRTLDEVCDLTGSPIAFYHFVEPDQKTLGLQAWSTRTLAEFCTAEGKGEHYPIAKAGVWVDCIRQRKPVIHNDYEPLKHKRGHPSGHARIIREPVVPIERGDKIVAVPFYLHPRPE